MNTIVRNVPSYDGMPAQRRLIASFHGSAFTAEREDDELRIYHVRAESVPTNTFGDATRRPVTDKSFFAEPLHMTASKYQAAIEGLRERDFWKYGR